MRNFQAFVRDFIPFGSDFHRFVSELLGLVGDFTRIIITNYSVSDYKWL